MEPTLTEFSYGYCVTEDFANGMGTGLKAAPYFPSLYAEGKIGGGFDVRIGSALFLQFKLCEELTRRSAKETQKGLLNPPFFRFWLHKRNRSAQHQMLIDLENQPGNQATTTAFVRTEVVRARGAPQPGHRFSALPGLRSGRVLELGCGGAIQQVDQFREILDLAMDQVRAEFFDAAMRGTRQEVARLRDIADGRNPRARQ